jgi:hydroxyacyl-ACP dehydratase HTD2-like protein with hotdog domain
MKLEFLVSIPLAHLSRFPSNFRYDIHLKRALWVKCRLSQNTTVTIDSEIWCSIFIADVFNELMGAQPFRFLMY